MNQHRRMQYYRVGVDETLRALQTSEDGLTKAEAAKRLRTNGPNTLQLVKHRSALSVLYNQLRNILVVMLFGASAICFYLGDIRTASILLAILSVNLLVGFFQEFRANKLVEKLEGLLNPDAVVVRGGGMHAVASRELVIGDIVYMEAGDSVPADVRIIDEAEFATNDFSLTGEHNPSRKFNHAIHADVRLQRRHNLAFLGTTVATGTAYGVVIATGMQTELGRIAHLGQSNVSDPSPLQKEMRHVTRVIALITGILAIGLAIVALLSDLSLENSLLFALGIAAAMIPSGLATEINSVLSIAASALAKQKALVKHLPAVEAIGAVDVILTDKTGTLTTNQMAVTHMLIGREEYGASGKGYEPGGEITHGRQARPVSSAQLKALLPFFSTALGASNAAVAEPDETHKDWYAIGEPTEAALVALAIKAGLDQETWNADNHELREFQFDAGRRLMSSLRRQNGQLVLLVKGAPETVLERSHHIWEKSGVRSMRASDRHEVEAYLRHESRARMRNIALAYKTLPAGTDVGSLKIETVEQDLIFLGVASMSDPLRDGVVQALKTARAAHVHVAVLTGDAPETALAVAKKAELSTSITVIDNEELHGLSDAQIVDLVLSGGAVFSRATPEDKLRIVDALKRSGHRVAVTGDGINDTPALTRADVGIAMGRDGADAAEEAAELILLDDSFKSLMGSVERGRLTYQNISRTVRCVLTTNFSELTIVLLGLLLLLALRIPPALPAIQILAIDIVAQLLPIIALAWDKPSHRLMRSKARSGNEHIITFATLKKLALYGSIAALLSYANYLFFFIRTDLSPVAIDIATPLYLQATTLTYLTLALCLYIHIVFERADTHEKFFTDYIWSNKKILAAFAVSLSMIIAIIYVPVLNKLFSTNPLDAWDWICALVAASLYFLLRLSQRQTRKHSRKAVLDLHLDLVKR